MNITDRIAEATDNIIEKIVGEEDQDYQLAIDYLVSNYPRIKQYAEANDVKPTLVAIGILDFIYDKNTRLNYRDIMNKENHELVGDYISAFFVKLKSIKQAKENSLFNKIKQKIEKKLNSKIVLKIKDGRTYKWPVKKALRSLGILAIAAVLFIGSIRYGKRISIKIEDDKISEALAELANPGSDDPLKKGKTISSQNEIYNSHLQRYSYDSINITQDILDVVSQAPELFDLCMYDVYYRIQNDRLAVMDTVIHHLKTRCVSDPQYEEIFAKLVDCDNFIEYIISNDLLEADSDLYYALNMYKQLGGYSKIPADFQSIIVEAMKRYRADNREKLHNDYEEYAKEVKVEETKGR